MTKAFGKEDYVIVIAYIMILVYTLIAKRNMNKSY